MKKIKFDLKDSVKHLDNGINYIVEYIAKTEKTVDYDSLFDDVNCIVDEWVSDMGINGYVMYELERKLKIKGVKVIE